MSIYSEHDCGALSDEEFANACNQMNYADHCSRCGWEIDYHGAFDIDGEHLCWDCFKKEDLKDQRDWEDDEPEEEDE